MIEILETENNSLFEINKCSVQRDWMDDSINKHAYKCTPVTSANKHGWTINLKKDVEVSWNGGYNLSNVTIKDKSLNNHVAGRIHGGFVTFMLPYVFMTTNDIYLWCSGPPNLFHKNAQPLTAVIESSWFNTQFQFSWKLMNPGITKFESGFPIMFFMPYKNNLMYEQSISLINKKQDILKYLDIIEKSNSYVKKINSKEKSWNKFSGQYRQKNID